MRYSRKHKESIRKRLLERGGSHAKKHGFGESGMAALSAAAGVTTGSLYKHFENKDDFFTALISAELTRTAEMYGAIDAADNLTAASALKAYLSVRHVQHPEAGCALPSLTQEVARATDSVREAFLAGLLEIHAKVALLTGSPDRAWALIAQNVGAVMLARALPNQQTQTSLLSALQRTGETLLKGDAKVSSKRSTT
jgi:TetR/AcrR family transcriptional repressor of nem operon